MKLKIFFLETFLIPNAWTMDEVPEKNNYVAAVQRFERQENLYETHSAEVIEKVAPLVERDQSEREIKDEKGTYAIINRPPQHNTLIIGCGNSTDAIYLPYYKVAFNTDEQEGKKFLEECHKGRGHNHSHPKCDTLDLSFVRNPTVLYSLGSRPDISEIFKGKTYSVIILEGCEWYPSLEEPLKAKVNQNILQLLNPEDGIVLFLIDARDNDFIHIVNEKGQSEWRSITTDIRSPLALGKEPLIPIYTYDFFQKLFK